MTACIRIKVGAICMPFSSFSCIHRNYFRNIDDIFLFLRYTGITNSKTCIMKWLSTLLPLSIMTLLTGFGKPAAENNNRPAAGSVKIVTLKIDYYSGNIEGSKTVATWPVAKFAEDKNAIRYSVKEIKTGKIYSWDAGEQTQAAYHVFPAATDIKNGTYYIGLGRTWSAEAGMANPQWTRGYMSSYGDDDKVEITIYY